MSDQQYMQLALELAARAEGRTSPNPPVGAVVVCHNEVVGRGFHPKAGQPHAEIFALAEADSKANGATLYVTLEPCNHQGRTGPCTEAIIAAGIRKVFVGTEDPNPLVAGRGIARLRAAGVEVAVGLLEDACQHLIAPFAKHVTKGLPFVTLKMAMTLDGQTATSSGDSRWISNEASRTHVHEMRNRCDAIMVGIGTVLADDPQLTTRLPQGGHDPIRIVVDSKLQLPPSSRLLNVDSSAKVIIVTTEAAPLERAEPLRQMGAEIIVLPAMEGRVDIGLMFAELGRRNIQSVLLEGGATLAAEALRRGMIDRIAIFVAPKMLGGNDGSLLFAGPGVTAMNDAVQLKNTRIRLFDGDILIEGEVA